MPLRLLPITCHDPPPPSLFYFPSSPLTCPPPPPPRYFELLESLPTEERAAALERVHVRPPPATAHMPASPACLSCLPLPTCLPLQPAIDLVCLLSVIPGIVPPCRVCSWPWRETREMRARWAGGTTSVWSVARSFACPPGHDLGQGPPGHGLGQGPPGLV